MEEHKIVISSLMLRKENGCKGYHNEQALNFVEAYSNEGKRLFGLLRLFERSSRITLYGKVLPAN